MEIGRTCMVRVCMFERERLKEQRKETEAGGWGGGVEVLSYFMWDECKKKGIFFLNTQEEAQCNKNGFTQSYVSYVSNHFHT